MHLIGNAAFVVRNIGGVFVDSDARLSAVGVVDLRCGVSGAQIDRVVAQNRSVFQFDFVGVGVDVSAFSLFAQDVDVFTAVF